MGVDLAGASGGDVLSVDEEVGRGARVVNEGQESSTPRVGMGGDCEVNDDMAKSCGRQE